MLLSSRFLRHAVPTLLGLLSTACLAQSNIRTKPITGTLTVSPSTVLYQGTFKLTGTLSPTGGASAPTGTVQFFMDGNGLGNATPISPGIPSTPTVSTLVIPPGNTYASGSHTISATHNGDPQNSGLVFPTLPFTIMGVPTTTTLFLCVGPTVPCPTNGVISPPPPYMASLTMSLGQTFNGSAQSQASDNSALTGNIDFSDTYNGVTTTLCILPVATAGACPGTVGTTQGTAVGVHRLAAVYSGDAAHNPSSSTVTLTVSPDTDSATLSSSLNPSTVRQPVTFTANFTGNIVPPTGPVTFLNGSTVLGTVPLVLNPGSLVSTATFTISSLPVGIDTITASYPATLDFNATSASVVQTVNGLIGGSFKIAVTPTPVIIGVGLGASLTVTITPINGFNQPVTLGCSNLPSESACTFTTANMAPGQTKLLFTTTAPHSCGSTQPYFLGRNGPGPLGSLPLALPAVAGLAIFLIPGRRRWHRALVAVIAVAGAMQMTGCGNCTDLGTHPNAYTIQVVGAAANSGEVEAQSVTINITF